MARLFKIDEKTGRIIHLDMKGDSTPVDIAQNLDPGNFHRRKARMDAINDMIEDDFAPKDGKKILDRLLKKKKKKDGKA